MRWFPASLVVSTLLLTLGLAPTAQAAPEMFAASFILHARGNDISSGTAPPYTANDWTALPLGYDCQHASPYTTNGAPSSRYCTPARRQRGHPATGRTITTWGRRVAPARNIGTGTPPKIQLQQSDLTLNGVTGYLPTHTPYLEQHTYATIVNAAGSFVAGGGAATTYSFTTYLAGWAIRPGANAFGGVMGLLGKLGHAFIIDVALSHPSSGTSSFAIMPVVGRSGTEGVTTQTNYIWNKLGTPVTVVRKAHGTFWTTGRVHASIGTDTDTPMWHSTRTGYDNRTPGGRGRIQLVTPTLAHRVGPMSNYHVQSAQIGMLTIQVPEPGAVLLLAVGAGVLVVLRRTSQRG